MKPEIELSFLIPAYNDEATIEMVITRAYEVAQLVAKTHEILVINDASRDNTGIVLSKLTAQIPTLSVTTHKKNLGYGQTIKELYYKAKLEWLFSVPGDFQIDPKEVEKLLPATKLNDLILGHRVVRQDSKERLRQSAIYNSLIRFLFNLKIHDINSVRLIKRSLIQETLLKSSSAFVDAELTIRAIRNGAAVFEVPIGHLPRKAGIGGAGKLGVILPTVWDMFRFRLNLL